MTKCIRALSTSSSPNPLLDQSVLPKFDELSVDDIEPAITTLLQKFSEDFTAFESDLAKASTKQRGFDDVLGRLDRISYHLHAAWSLVGHLTRVANTSELREVEMKLMPDVVQVLATRPFQSKVLFQSICELQQSNELLTDNIEKHIVESWIKSMERRGIGLEPTEQAQFNANTEKLEVLSSEFSNNVLDAIAASEIIVTNPDEIEGLPPSSLEFFAKLAEESGHDEATATGGPWKIDLTAGSVERVLKDVRCSDMRERVYRDNLSVAGPNPCLYLFTSYCASIVISNLQSAMLFLLARKNQCGYY